MIIDLLVIFIDLLYITSFAENVTCNVCKQENKYHTYFQDKNGYIINYWMWQCNEETVDKAGYVHYTPIIYLGKKYSRLPKNND